MTLTAEDFRCMADALRLAARGEYSTRPNPRVGCVIVRDGVAVGRGFHHHAGGPHAEVVALGEAGAAARGATAYVTLEPCNHHGRTPPCVDALIAAGITRVVYAGEDPNPLVADRVQRACAPPASRSAVVRSRPPRANSTAAFSCASNAGGRS
jgi:diaminohydroxyphosphoribosylaminopyrimidine deaminase/5-amino-6-(5-phosphoribosylamino)uracil reductase